MQDRFKRGRANIKRKLTPEQITYIRTVYRKPYYAEELALMFGVHWATIFKVVKRGADNENATDSHNAWIKE